MPKNTGLLRIGIVLLLGTCSLKATWYDNRYIPWFDRQATWLYEELSLFEIEGFAASGREAWGTKDTTIGNPEIHGFLNLNTLAEAFVKTGRPNPLPSAWRGASIPLDVTGKLQAQGMSFLWHQNITEHCAFGASCMFMSVNSCQRFNLSKGTRNTDQGTTNLSLGSGDKLLLENLRRSMFNDIGILYNEANQIGFSDMNFYFQVGKQWEYQLKCRSVKTGLRCGVLVPSGLLPDLDSPASIPFGFDGHWGLYFSMHGMLEVKEDMKIGMVIDISKRFEQCALHRVSVAGEPDIFGALIAPVSVNPGPTVAVSPYFMLQNVREGLQVGVAYTLTKHQKDRWHDSRENKTIPINLKKSTDLSEWGSSYFTLSAGYDFGKTKVKRCFEPIVSLQWDVPFDLFVTEQVVKTNVVSLSIDFVF